MEKKQRGSDRENESHRENKHRKEEDRLSGDDDRYKDKYDRKKDKYREKDRSNKKRKHDDDRYFILVLKFLRYYICIKNFLYIQKVQISCYNFYVVCIIITYKIKVISFW